MMKKNNFLEAIFFSTLFIATEVLADEVRSNVINIPEQKISSLAHSSKSQPIFTHIEKMDSICDGECKKLDISWAPLSAPVLVTSENEYTFASGVEGVSVRIKIQRDLLNIDLIKAGNFVNAGKLSPSPLIRRTLKYFNESNVLIKTVSEDISMNGKVVSGGCFIPDGQNMNVKLPPVSLSQLNKTPAGQVLKESSGQTVIHVHCDSPLKSEMKLYFKSVMSDKSVNNPTVLPALTSSGKSSGVGFIMQLNNKPVVWDGTTPAPTFIENTMDISIPINVFYTRTTGDITPGPIHATGLIVFKHS